MARKRKKNTKGIHQALDLFAKVGTKLYAPLDCEVVSIGASSSYGNTITLKVTGQSLEILKIRQRFINYKPIYQNKGEVIRGDGFCENTQAYYLFYAHLSKINVKQEDKMVAGQVIGFSGVSGNAKGTKAPHLHFEIRNQYDAGKGLTHRVNPALYIECKKLLAEFSQDEKDEQQEICGKTCKLPTK